MTPEEIRLIVREAVQEAVQGALETSQPCKGCCTSCELTPNEHRDHHEAIRGAMRARSTILSQVLKVLGSGLAVLSGLALWEYIRLKMGQ